MLAKVNEFSVFTLKYECVLGLPKVKIYIWPLNPECQLVLTFLESSTEKKTEQFKIDHVGTVKI